MRDPRLEKLAGVLVNYSVGVKKGQLVRISGPPVSQPLIVALYEKVLEAGGHPAVRMVPEELNEIFLKNANDEQLALLQSHQPLRIREARLLDRHLGRGKHQGPDQLRPEKDRHHPGRPQAADGHLHEARRRGKAPLGRHAVPLAGLRQDAEMSLAEYEDFVFTAGLLDQPDPVAAWKKVSERQQRLVDFLNGKTDYHVKAANGTDVRMSLAGKTWINCDGHENFPDGEVFSGPVIDSVDGQINFSFPAVHHGREVRRT